MTGWLKASFPYFLEKLWLSIGLPKPAMHQMDMAAWLEQGPQYRGIKAFRGASKTWITVAYITWRLYRNPNEKIMLVSKSQIHAHDSLHMIRQWFLGIEWLEHMNPEKHQRRSATKFDVAEAAPDRMASLMAFGITGQVTGARATLIVADDIETLQNTITADQRDKLREQSKEFNRIAMPGSDIIFLGTPHAAYDSLYEKLRHAGFDFRSWPVKYPKEEVVPDLSPELRRRLASGEAQPGEPVWPEVFDAKSIVKLEKAEGRTTFRTQYMMCLSEEDEEEFPLRLGELILFNVQKDKAPATITWGKAAVMGGDLKSTKAEDIATQNDDSFYYPVYVDEQYLPYSGTRMWIDPSGKGTDQTGYAIISHCNGMLYIKAAGGLEGGYSDPTLEKLARLAREHGATEIFIEDLFGMAMYAKLFENVLRRFFIPEDNEDDLKPWKASIEDYRPTFRRGKEDKIISILEPLFNQHRLVVDVTVAQNMDFQYQVSRIRREKNSIEHDDIVESLSLCCHMWGDVMDLDPEFAAQRQKEYLFDKALEDHRRLLSIDGRKQPRWARIRSA